MKINEHCLPCLVNQVVKVAELTQASHKDELYKKIFAYMSHMDFAKTNPEIIGETFQMLKEHIGHDDPYYSVRQYYNQLFLKQIDKFEQRMDCFETTVKYAIMGNIIDFNPIHHTDIEDVMRLFDDVDQQALTINHISHLMSDIKTSQTLLYLGDNCGEICLDLLMLKQIKMMNPQIHIYFGVRGTPVVNDSIEEDAYFVGINQYATIISNGDSSLGTVLNRTSDEFQDIYKKADIVIAKGQANFESLSEEDKNIYFLLMVKCAVISQYIGVAQKSLVCMKNKKVNKNNYEF